MISQGSAKHKLQFLIGDQVLPFNMTVYQAVRQFGCSGVDHSEAEADSEPPLGHDAVWVQTHTIYYRYNILLRRYFSSQLLLMSLEINKRDLFILSFY